MADAEQNKVINDILSTADALPEDRTNYSNTVHVEISGNDVIIDFFLLTPTRPNDPRPQVKHVQRMILPIPIARDMGDIVVNATNEWGKIFGVKLPLVPVQTDDPEE